MFTEVWKSILEAVGRNTAPAAEPGGVMLVLPSDHVVIGQQRGGRAARLGVRGEAGCGQR